MTECVFGATGPNEDAAEAFHHALLRWFDAHGRKDLPWQTKRTPYAVWISEIMLQQTQVATVIPYFERFMRAFPSLEALAEAPLDRVLAHWSGLGYYARARNLHRAAQAVISRHSGALPAGIEPLLALPGIGRSTAGAILAIGFGVRAPILDGNVKRVLARYHAVAGWPGEARVAARLWQLAEQHTLKERVGDYTQAMMDLGATLCTRGQPACARCPVSAGCAAARRGNPHGYPGPRPARERPLRTLRFLLLTNAAGELLLERQPAPGVWGGLWSVPSVSVDADWIAHVRNRYGFDVIAGCDWPARRHAFTHFELEMRPTAARAVFDLGGVREMAGVDVLWYNTRHALPGGCPAPIKRLLQAFQTGSGTTDLIDEER